MKHNFYGGKYTVEFDEQTGALSALRYGEPWQRDLAGDKLLLSMLQAVDAERDLLDRAYGLIDSLEAYIDDDDSIAAARLRERMEGLRRDILNFAEDQNGG